MANDSILDSVKKVVSIAPEYDAFDPDIIMHINSVFFTLHQLGIGPEDGFAIEDEHDMWDTFLEDKLLLNSVKSYIYLRVRMLFDPPPNSFTQASMKEQIQEFEWRLSVYREGLVYPAQVTLVSDQ